MKVAAVTITFNRLDLTKRTVESLYSKSKLDYHLFIDNGSTDGTTEYLKSHNHILLEKNYGIAYAFREAVSQLQGYDLILKLDNDIEIVTDEIIEKMIRFYSINGPNYVCSPIDLALDPAYAPASLGNKMLSGFDCRFVTHTGGAFQIIPYQVCKRLCDDFRHLKAGDYMIGKYYRRLNYKPTYLADLQMRHVGINQSCKNYIL
jgi:glycosyltransferase involved in cell wall biosynthesis